VVKVIEILAESPNGWDDAARQAVSEAGNAVPCFRVRDLLASDHTFFAVLSFITSSSRSRSASTFLSRAFSCSTCLSRLTSAARHRNAVASYRWFAR
jgi:Dodecin